MDIRIGFAIGFFSAFVSHLVGRHQGIKHGRRMERKNLEFIAAAREALCRIREDLPTGRGTRGAS